MKHYLYIFSLFIETEKQETKDHLPQAKQPHKPSNPTSKANLWRSQKADNTAYRATLRRKQASKHPTKKSKLFEESSTPATKATLRRKQYPND